MTRRLRAASVCDVEAGLTQAEFTRIEKKFGFQFADDHRAFLTQGLPVNTGLPPQRPGVIYTHPQPWPDWRHGDPDTICVLLDRPVEGVLFDVEHNGLWPDTWGTRPAPPKSAIGTARRLLRGVPRMVPVYGHRYLPAGRGTFSHPVLSMWQTDIIIYGSDLVDYIDHEFSGAGHQFNTARSVPQIMVEFWCQFL